MARTIVHLSDLHFGAILAPTLDPLVTAVHGIAPDLVIISGDLTQRAREEQYRDAQAYLARLPGPQLVVPGNHDVPLYDVYRRFAQPLARYKRYITPDLAPTFEDDEIVVVGVNSARSLVFKGGRISGRQTREAAARFDAADARKLRVLVTHHPFTIPELLDGVRPVVGAAATIRRLAASRMDLALSGHVHLAYCDSSKCYAPDHDVPMLVAGTATSTRARREANSFYVIRADERTLHVETRRWMSERCEFVMAETRVFMRHGVSGAPDAGRTGGRAATSA